MYNGTPNKNDLRGMLAYMCVWGPTPIQTIKIKTKYKSTN